MQHLYFSELATYKPITIWPGSSDHTYICTNCGMYAYIHTCSRNFTENIVKTFDHFKRIAHFFKRCWLLKGKPQNVEKNKVRENDHTRIY